MMTNEFIKKAAEASINWQKVIKDITPAVEKLNTTVPNLSQLIPDFKQTSTFLVIEALKREQAKIDYMLKQVSSTANMFSKISESMLVKFDPIFNLGFTWQGIMQGFLEPLKFTKEEEFKNFEYNWVGFLTVPEIKELYKSWKEGKEDKVKEYFFQWFSDEKKIKFILNKFEKNEFFKGRVQIINDAFEAHIAGKYTMSIPVLFSQIDGVFIEKHKNLKGKVTFECKECSKKSPAELNARNISEYLAKKESEYLPEFLVHINDTFANLRNDILHGKKLDYPNKDLSTKLVITLYQLHCSIKGYS